MRKTILALILAVCAPAWCSTEYLRPTTDTDPGVAVCSTTNEASVSMSAVYSGKSGAGPTGSSATQTVLYSSSNDFGKSRIFSGWQSATKTYTSLTLYYSGSCSGTGMCNSEYSTNGGSTWAAIGSSVVITGTALSSLRVRICVESSTISGSTVLTTADIWTAGTYTVNTSHPYTWLMSALDEQIWRWHDATARSFSSPDSSS